MDSRSAKKKPPVDVEDQKMQSPKISPFGMAPDVVDKKQDDEYHDKEAVKRSV